LKKLKKILKDKYRNVKSIFISSYVPRKCGIATYTRDLTRALDLISPHFESKIIAMVKPEDKIKYSSKVKFEINKYDISSYVRAARYINKSSDDIVVIEHEFGLYGGEFGKYINELARRLKKLLIITSHTIPDNPYYGYGAALKDLIRFATRIIVMMPESREKLAKSYNYPREKIEVIPHGVPDISLESDIRYHSKCRFRNSLILGSINLLSENKGIEYAIEALPGIKKEIPDVLYLIIGQTHPNVLQTDGEKYRNFLQEKVNALGLEKNVRFINKYVSIKELISWLMTFDIYITPYLDSHQSASGALAYAIGAGKICISTPYAYAKDVLSEERGIIIPFRNPGAITDAAINVAKNYQKRMEIEKKVYKYGRLMTWYNVAMQHLRLFNKVMDEYRYKEETGEFKRIKTVKTSAREGDFSGAS